MESEETIKTWIKQLQKIVDEPGTSIESRIAWLELHLLRRIIEDVKGWESVTDDLKMTADLIRKENGL
jgi:hypothetical protein